MTVHYRQVCKKKLFWYQFDRELERERERQVPNTAQSPDAGPPRETEERRDAMTLQPLMQLKRFTGKKKLSNCSPSQDLQTTLC